MPRTALSRKIEIAPSRINWDKYESSFYKKINGRQSSGSKIFIIIFAILLIASILLFLFYNNSTISGKIIKLDKTTLAQEEPLKGSLELKLKEGEFIPHDILARVSLDDKIKEIAFRDFIQKSNSGLHENYGNYFFTKAEISGSGFGYGWRGKKVSYAQVFFELEPEIFAINGGSTKINGDAKYGEKFVYDGQANLVQGSVRTLSKQLGDDAISLTKENGKTTVSTNYYEETFDFGKEYLTDIEHTISFDISILNLGQLSPGAHTLKTEFIYQNRILISESQKIEVMGKNETKELNVHIFNETNQALPEMPIAEMPVPTLQDNVGACGTLFNSNTTYDVTTDIYSSTTGVCLAIGGSNITLDCHRKAIRSSIGPNEGLAINVASGSNNITIKNCVIDSSNNNQFFWNAIRLQGGNNTWIINSTLSATSSVIVNSNSNYVYIKNCTFNRSTYGEAVDLYSHSEITDSSVLSYYFGISTYGANVTLKNVYVNASSNPMIVYSTDTNLINVTSVHSTGGAGRAFVFSGTNINAVNLSANVPSGTTSAKGVSINGNNIKIKESQINSTGYGVYITNSLGNNSIADTVIKSAVTDFYSSNSTNDTITDMTFNSSSYPTKISFSYSGDISVDSSNGYADSGMKNISKYIDITNSSAANMLLNMSYSHSDISGVNESSLKIYKQYGTAWALVQGSGVDTARNIVYANITSFSTFAILSAEMNCSNCTDCNNKMQDGITLKLSQDAWTNVSCIMINVSNIVFDCQNHVILNNGTTGLRSAVSLWVGSVAENITIKNCIINSTNYGFNTPAGNFTRNLTIRDSVFYGTGSAAIYGVLLARTNSSYILNNSIRSFTNNLYIGTDAYYNVIENNTIGNASTVGIQTANARTAFNNITGNSITVLHTPPSVRDMINTGANTTIWNNNFYGRGLSNSTIGNTWFLCNPDSASGVGNYFNSISGLNITNQSVINGTCGRLVSAYPPPKVSNFDGATTNFSIIDSGYANLTLENTTYGRINWNPRVFVEHADFDSYFSIGNSSIIVNISYLPANVSSAANITFYGISFNQPRIAIDPELDGTYKLCSDCSIISYSSGNLTFNTTHFSGIQGFEQNLSSCGNLSVENAVYYLNNSISTSGTCFNVQANNATLDCAGFRITGDGSGNGISFSGIYHNITVKNCNISDFSNGIFTVDATSGLDIINSYISASTEGVLLNNKQNVLILNSTILGGDENQIQSVSNITIINSTLSGTNFNGLFMLGQDITLENNALSGATALKLGDSLNVHLINQPVSSYNFGNVESLTIEDTNEGGISYLQNITQTGSNFSADMNIEYNLIELNSSQTGLNKSANLTLYGTDSLNLTDRHPYRNGVRCPASICTELSDSDTYVFNVTGFTNYSLGESDITPPNLTILFPVPGQYYSHNQTLNFSASDDVALGSCWKNLNNGQNVTISCNANNTVNSSTQGTVEGNNTVYLWANDTVGNVANTSVSYTIISAEPKITSISMNSSIDPAEDNYTSVVLYFTAMDAKGTEYLNQSSASAKFTKSGEATRANNSCAFVGNIDSQNANFSCSIDMWYWDAPGTWTVNVSISSDEGINATNDTATFDYNTLIAFKLAPDTIYWNTITRGVANQSPASGNFSVLRNTGNKDVPDGGIQINASSLAGNLDSNYKINAENFTASPAQITACSGTRLMENIPIGIYGIPLLRGNQSTANIYYCLAETSADLIKQSYSTLTSWYVKIVALALILPAKRKKARKKKILDGLDQELKKEYNITFEKIIPVIDELKKNKITLKDIGSYVRAERELSVPLSLFRTNELGPLELLVKYLKENLKLRLSEIAERLNRDDRTVWMTYRNASSKRKTRLSAEDKIELPVQMLGNRNLSILENIIIYLRNLGKSNSEIARILNKDVRNIYTLHKRAVKKLSLRAN